MTLAEHLEELRSRLMKATIAFAIAFIALWAFRADVVQFIRLPFDWAMAWLNEDLVGIYEARVEAGAPASEFFTAAYPVEKTVLPELRVSQDLNYLQLGAKFFFRLKVCFWLALFVAGPYALFQLWAFIAAGLYRTERKVVYSYFPASLLLFVAGVSFGFLVMIPYAAYFLSKDGLGVPGEQLTIAADQYLNFIKGLALAVGVVFQLPVIQFALARLGVVDPRTYRKYRGHMIVGSLLVSAVLTPPDPITQMLLAGPAIVLYEIGAAIARLAWTPAPGAVDPAPSEGAGA